MANILVVDDDKLLRGTLRALLESAGHRIEEAANGFEGLERFTASRPDVVLIDIIMPKCEGLETIGQMRKLHQTLPIIAMSGGGRLGGDLFLRTAAELGATETLSKPFRNAELTALIDQCLRQQDSATG